MNERLLAGAGRSMALTWRLVLGYVVGVVLTLTVVALFLHRSLRQSFEMEDLELLSDNVTEVRREVIRRPGDLHEAAEIIVRAAGERDLEKYYGRLLDDQGTILVMTPGVDGFGFGPAEFPPPVAADRPLGALTNRTAVSGRKVWMAAAMVDQGPGRAPLVYQILFDASHVEDWMAGYRRTLGWMIGFATVSSGALGWVIARRGLAPLREITASVQRVTAAGLDERLGARRWPEELAALAVEFDGMLARLRESFQRLSQFTADAAHEFRTPLNSLMMTNTLLLSRNRSPEEYRDALAAQGEVCERLSRLVERLLFLARADDARATLRRDPIPARQAAEGVAEFFSALAEEKGVAIEITGEATVMADPTLLRQALTNLVSNALRHTPAGGTVTLALEATPEGGAVIAVRDTGCGLSPEHLARVFDRFYQVDTARDGSTAGAGLGLALVQTTMTLHGGTATVESHPGQGATFRLVFPPFRIDPEASSDDRMGN